MGQNTRGIYPNKSNNTWEVDKWWRGERFRQRGFVSFEEADRWLIKQLAEAREVVLHGARKARIFDSVAAHYLMTNRDKASLETEAFLLKSIMPFIGQLELAQIHDATLAPYVVARKKEGRANKTINLALGVVRRILNLAATTWRDEDGRTWLGKEIRAKRAWVAECERNTRDGAAELLRAALAHLQGASHV